MTMNALSITKSLLSEASKYLVHDGGYAYFTDPVYPGLIRNRVNAEICKCMIRLGEVESVPAIIRYICSKQAADGSWNEIHMNYNQPSALITSFIGEALVEAYSITPQDDAMHLAAQYVLNAEVAPGSFLKSEKYTADCLNVNASCGSFLAKYGKLFSDEKALAAAERAALQTCRFQKPDGAYPYTSDKGTYNYVYDIPCVHYQGVTMYYLQKINEVIENLTVNASLQKGAEWLASVQYDDGSFDWSNSGLNFAYYLSGAPAFAYAVFAYAKRFDKTYEKNKELSLLHLQKQMRGIMLRWEDAGFLSFFPDIITSWKSASLGQYPLKERMFRMGYCLYRQAARRRYSDSVDPKFFKALCSLMRIQSSTVEPFNNFPDMFMTSEVLDCLSWTISR